TPQIGPSIYAEARKGDPDAWVEVQGAFLWWEEPNAHYASLFRQGRLPEQADEVLRYTLLWPLSKEQNPWPVVAETVAPLFPSAAWTDNAPHGFLIRTTAKTPFKADPFGTRAEPDSVQSMLEEAKTRPGMDWAEIAAPILTALGVYRMVHQEFPPTLTEAIAELHLGVNAPLWEDLLKVYPNSAFLRSPDHSRIGLLLVGPGQATWLLTTPDGMSLDKCDVRWTDDPNDIAALLPHMEAWGRCDLASLPQFEVSEIAAGEIVSISPTRSATPQATTPTAH
ncbi:MAG: hypothetical protein ABI743_02585, partial [bacterium]